MPRPRVVLIANLLGHDGVPHAGGQYMQRLCRLLDDEVELTVLVPNNPATRAASRQTGTPRDARVVGWAGPGDQHRSLAQRALGRASTLVDARRRRSDPGLPPLAMASELVADRRLRRLIREADVIDLQWSECIRLAALMRRLNPRARLVGTYHDVQSQRFEREASASASVNAGADWRRAADAARRHEERMVGVLDEVLVFSDKDSTLLRDPPNLRIVRPPLAGIATSRHAPPAGDPSVLFVSHLARPENELGVRWFLANGWPLVRRQVPHAKWRLAGAGASESLRRAVAEAEGVELTGYVPSLESEYAGASVIVIPLQQGAGLKFKTVEALLAGVPVVTTTVGAEGVAPDDHFVAVTDDPIELASHVAAVLLDPARHRARADEAQRAAQEAYGGAAFRESIHAAYGWQ